MTDAEVAAALDAIRAEDDPGTKHFRVAALVSGFFRAQGADPVVVGGSAVEFYTEGAYVSGDLDIWRNFAGSTGGPSMRSSPSADNRVLVPRVRVRNGSEVASSPARYHVQIDGAKLRFQARRSARRGRVRIQHALASDHAVAETKSCLGKLHRDGESTRLKIDQTSAFVDHNAVYGRMANPT